MKNKKGQSAIGIIMFFVILFVILILGFMASMVIGVIDFASDEVTPVMESLGVVHATNLSDVSSKTFGVADTFVQALPWLVGFAYVCAIIFSIVFAISYPQSQHPVFIALYFALIIFLIFGSIVISNMYENIYNQSNALSDRLNEQTILSYMILFSPLIFTIIAFITGIYVFTRGGEGL